MRQAYIPRITPILMSGVAGHPRVGSVLRLNVLRRSAMNQERPAPEDVPGSDGIEVLRDQNGTGDEADEEQLGVSKEDVKDLANDAEGG